MRVLPALALLLAACGGGGGDDDSGGLTADEVARIHHAVDVNLGHGLATGYSIAIWRDGAVIYAEGFGAADDAGRTVTPDTLFQIGSDTKKMTAIALLQQVEAGRASLDQSVGDLVPDLMLAQSPSTLDALTLDALISHRSGLWDYTPWTEAADDRELSMIAHGRFADNEYPMMPPGIAWSYANPNFSLAGLVTETVDGRRWPQILSEDVLAPLGMDHTYPRRDDAIAAGEDLASGQGTIFPDGADVFDLWTNPAATQGWVAPADQVDNAFTRPAGLVWSTATDQARLLGFLVEGDPAVLSDELRAEITTPHAPIVNHAQGDDYGYGLAILGGYTGAAGDFHDTPLWVHGGNTLTMTSASYVLPDLDVAVSVLANGANEDLSAVADTAVEVAAGAGLPAASTPPQILPPAATDLAPYAGSFTDPNLGDITITFDTDHLTIDIPLATQMGITYDPTLRPLGLDYFDLVVEGQDFPISFFDAPDGTPHAYGVNRSFVLTRVGG